MFHRTLTGRLVLICLTAVLLSAALTPAASAAVTEPRLRLLAPSGEVVLFRYGVGEPVYMELGLLMAALDAPLELRARRPDYTQPPVLEQVLYGPGPQSETRTLDATLLDGWSGLAGFFELQFTDSTGAVAASKEMTFCPGGYDRQRLNDEGPDVPTYPTGCFANPFTKGAVWGIDTGWAVGVTSFDTALEIPNGLYNLSVTIPSTYIELFGIDPAFSSAEMTVRVKTYRDFCRRGCRKTSGSSSTGSPAPAAVPTLDNPGDEVLPDLMALPSWGISVENRRDRSTLSFGANVWNGGAGPLVVEGFRRDDQDVMDGFQYFYDGEEVVGKAPAGELEFDERDGHDHWHFKQFAAYSLLDPLGNEVRVSRKEAFCLAPTDAIDLTIPGADWNPGSIGLGSACGGPNSIWTREILPLGWGDTYFQGLPGQSFYITNLPNGHYFIRVEANPGGLLYEQTSTNNVELREIILKGKPGARRVVVPPWNGIDTEGVVGRG